ncbi:hypothetical protein CAPTEDRAFT_21692 [Capitella teleta]|uniref:D-isomer specific 2-hydroxyacid dehydrogenase NAD-binding domain-containing protein n=1 Tax=Capitella teleta TaxID=283909 RepID=R7VES4_CAPTE|nr:hypothetical protein CAPTEDRAFT_21692 [Capitella teleta]|eukprot:ELU14791.1 hypothetical protein CAPTEDRAFT_21692 [Capitella teleta]
MQSTWAGIDSLVKSLDPSKPLPSYKITKFGGAFGPMMSEFVFAQIIALERGFAGMMNSQKQKSWDHATFGVYRPLAGLTLGILGVGDIGKHIAKIAKLFGMQVWGLIRTKPDAHPDYLDEYRLTDGLPELLSQCDYVCNVLPDTSSTTGVLSAGMLKHCKSKSPVFINVGRGNILSEADIVEALDMKWIRHAILDVFPSEPLSEESPLWGHPHVTITPHVSAMSMMESVSDLFVENYKRFTSGQPLHYVSSFEAGY